MGELRSKFKKLVTECKKLAFTIKTASGVQNFIRERGYGAAFDQLYALVKTRDSCNPEKAVEPSALSVDNFESNKERAESVGNCETSDTGGKEEKGHLFLLGGRSVRTKMIPYLKLFSS